MMVFWRGGKGEARARYHKIADSPFAEEHALLGLEVANQVYWRIASTRLEGQIDSAVRAVAQSASGATFLLRLILHVVNVL